MDCNVNWREVITHINRMGLSGAKIGQRLGVAETTINSLKNEWTIEPRYSLGVKLRDLEARLVAAGLE